MRCRALAPPTDGGVMSGVEVSSRADPDWPDWYALFMVRERAGEELPT